MQTHYSQKGSQVNIAIGKSYAYELNIYKGWCNNIVRLSNTLLLQTSTHLVPQMTERHTAETCCHNNSVL